MSNVAHTYFCSLACRGISFAAFCSIDEFHCALQNESYQRYKLAFSLGCAAEYQNSTVILDGQFFFPFSFMTDIILYFSAGLHPQWHYVHHGLHRAIKHILCIQAVNCGTGRKKKFNRVSNQHSRFVLKYLTEARFEINCKLSYRCTMFRKCCCKFLFEVIGKYLILLMCLKLRFYGQILLD